MTDPLEAYRVQLAQLGDLPVAAHPDALEEVHRGLVGELDTLGSGRALREDPAPATD